MRPDLEREAVFIHSLFRAGSTYLFNAFRRSPAGYYCYQEPHNEILLNASRDPEKLLEFHEETGELLRHPSLQRPYFWEFYIISEVVAKHFKKEFCYDDFFVTEATATNELNAYHHALIENAKGRPLFQCCRTIGRVRSMKAALGGRHCYLWRDPWDQWWSYKVASYFDVVNLLTLNARNLPAFLKQLRTEFGIGEFHSQDISQEFHHFEKRRLNSDQSYSLFYSLWCYGFLETRTDVDIRFNIDSLAASQSYREDVVAKLKTLGIEGVDFSDCRMNQGCYSVKEEAFFRNNEERVHALLLRHGYTRRDLDELVSARNEHVPAIRKRTPTKREAAAESGYETAIRARAIALRYENDVAFICRQITAAEEEVAKERELLGQTHARLIETEQRMTAQESETVKVKAELVKVKAELEQAQALAEGRGHELASVYASRSWRITTPLRKSKKFLKCTLRTMGRFIGSKSFKEDRKS